jgi:hypothetical protein
LRPEIAVDNTASTSLVALQRSFGFGVDRPETSAAVSVSTAGRCRAKDQKPRSGSVGRPLVAMASRSGAGYLPKAAISDQGAKPTHSVRGLYSKSARSERNRPHCHPPATTQRRSIQPLFEIRFGEIAVAALAGLGQIEERPRGRPDGDAWEKRTVQVRAQPRFSGASGIETLMRIGQNSPLSREPSGGNSNGQRDECCAQRRI